MKSKFAKETLTITTEIVLPNDTNALGNLHGGKLMLWMDVVSAISAHRLCKQVVVTASVNNISFRQSIKLGSIVTLEAKVSRTFHTSIEVVIDVLVEDRLTSEKKKHNEAIFTYVAVDQNGSPLPSYDKGWNKAMELTRQALAQTDAV